MERFRLRKMLGVALLAGAIAACDDEMTGPGGGGGGTPPAAPTGLSVGQLSLTSVRVSWTAVTGATSYVLERASAANPGVFTGVGGSLANPTHDDTGLTAGVAYSYRVAAVNADGQGDFSTALAVTTGLQAATLSADVTSNRTLFRDTVYTLSGFVKVQNGATLTIEAGTKIVGDTTVLGSSLWILRGAQIIAEGTATDPIVFTSARAPGNRKPGDWGGLIIIGNGIINRTGGTILTEGGTAGVAENYAGGTDNTDSSGRLKYVRIEFAGYDISNGAGQELNSLSMYAVGGGTTLEYVQTMSGLDDSFEWWGGAVDGRYLISYESGDDHFDWSEGFVGRNQFLIAFQTQRLNPAPMTGSVSSDPRGFEGDGCDPGVSGCTLTTTGASEPYSNPVFANFTLVGTGNLGGFPTDGNGAVIRRGSAGTFNNGIIARFKGTGIQIRDAWTDSLLVGRDSLNLTNIILAENSFHYDTTNSGRFGFASKFTSDNHRTAAAATDIITSLNPAGLDWTPVTSSMAETGGGMVPAAKIGGYFGDTFAQTTFIGAADPAGPKWWEGWSNYIIN